MNPSDSPVALITGGGGGIGRAAAVAFARAGYRIAIADINADAAREVGELLRTEGFDALTLIVDVGDGAAVQDMLAQVRERYGRLDAAFNNAGASSLRTPLADVDDADWERVMRTNVSGTFLCMKHQIRWMLELGGGRIVNNCSVFGMGGGISATYTASKHAIAGLTRSAAISYAKQNIRINAVCPGLIDAGMGARFRERAVEDVGAVLALHPAGRIGTAEEVADAAVWLCSEQARYIHGHLLPVDGGYSAR